MARVKRDGFNASLSTEELAVVKWVEEQTGQQRKPLMMLLYHEKVAALGGDVVEIKAKAKAAADGQ